MNLDNTYIVIINTQVVYGPVTLKKATAYLNDRLWAMETTDYAMIAKVISNGP